MPDPRDLEISRRNYIQAGVMFGTSIPLGVRGGIEAAETVENRSRYSGVPDRYAESEWFQDRLLELYPEAQVKTFSTDKPNVIVDVRYVAGEELPVEALEFIETEFEDHGINTLVLEYENRYPREEFIEEYGASAENIVGSDRPVDVALGLNQGFYGEVEDYMKQAGIQVFCVPGKQFDPYPGHMVDWDKDSETYPIGVAVGTRTAIPSNLGQEPYSTYQEFVNNREKVAMHEIGHTLGLEHHPNRENVMYESTAPGPATYSDVQWEQVVKQLS